VYDSLYDHIKNALNKNGYKLLGFSFELNYQMYPEEPKEIMPMVKLELPEKELDKE
jgi:phage-related protein